MKKYKSEVWNQLRDIFMELQDETALTVFKELMRLNLVDEATSYMIVLTKDKLSLNQTEGEVKSTEDENGQ